MAEFIEAGQEQFAEMVVFYTMKNVFYLAPDIHNGAVKTK